jgi:hypothetical protein
VRDPSVPATSRGQAISVAGGADLNLLSFGS